MVAHQRFRVLFSDIGGVLGTNGWDTELRRKIAAHFGVELSDVERRHQLLFDSYERGYMSFEHYLERVFFAVPRDFTLHNIRDYAYNASVPWPENIAFFNKIKHANHLKLALISNEGRGITEHRIGKFGLRELADFLVISNFVHFRKPDRQIWELALNLAQVTPAESIYIDDREMFVNIAADIGFTAMQYVGLADMRQRLRELGLAVE